MPKQTFNLKFNKNTGRVISPSELVSNYLFGIGATDSAGNPFPENFIEFYIDASQQEIEKYLDIKIIKQVVEEEFHFQRGNYWYEWSYVHTTFPVAKGLKLQGFLNDVKQVDFPDSWISSKKTSDGYNYQRRVNLVPSYQQGGQITSNELIYTGILANTGGLVYHDVIPDYWTVRYVTGFDQIPADIINAIGKLASIELLNIKGDNILTPGIANESIGIDSLSQSIGTTASAENNALSARVRMYQDDLKKTLARLERTYKGFSFGVA